MLSKMLNTTDVSCYLGICLHLLNILNFHLSQRYTQYFLFIYVALADMAVVADIQLLMAL